MLWKRFVRPVRRRPPKNPGKNRPAVIPIRNSRFRIEGNAMHRFWDRNRLSELTAGIAPFLLMTLFLFLALENEAGIVRFFQEWREGSPVLTDVMEFLTHYGNIPFYCCYGAMLYWFLRQSDERAGNALASYLLVLFLLLLVVDTLKIWVGRPRPGELGEWVILSLSGTCHSFPSSHMAETVFTVLSLLFCRRRGLLPLGCGIWIAVMGLTRLYLGRHYPTDLLAGAVLGCLAAFLAHRLYSLRFGRVLFGIDAPERDERVHGM